MIQYIPLKKKFANEETVIDPTVIDSTVITEDDSTFIGAENEAIKEKAKLSETEQQEINDRQLDNKDIINNLDSKKILLYIFTEDAKDENPYWKNVSSKEDAKMALLSMNSDFRNLDEVSAILGDIQKIEHNVVTVGMSDWKFDAYAFSDSKDLYVYGHLSDLYNAYCVEGLKKSLLAQGCNLNLVVNDIKVDGSFNFYDWTKKQAEKQENYTAQMFTNAIPDDKKEIQVNTTTGQYGYKGKLGYYGFMILTNFFSK